MENLIKSGNKVIGKYYGNIVPADYKAIEELKLLAERDGFCFSIAFPDLHAGNNIPVGHITKFKNMVYYDITGPDIGCNVTVVEVETDITNMIDDICDFVFNNLTGRDIPSIGGGNHFFEVTGKGNKYHFVLHTGSRGEGAKCYKLIEDDFKLLRIKGINKQAKPFRIYQNWYETALIIAEMNSNMILERIQKQFSLKYGNRIRTYHNTIIHDGNYVYHYKGASYVKNGELAAIPLNMRDGTLIVKALNTSELFNGINHGAGRKFSRKEAKQKLDESSLNNIEYLSKGNVIDEAPDAYKNIDNDMIDMENAGYIKIVDRLLPIKTVKS